MYVQCGGGMARVERNQDGDIVLLTVRNDTREEYCRLLLDADQAELVGRSLVVQSGLAREAARQAREVSGNVTQE